VTDVAEEEAVDAVETSIILALSAWKNTHRKKRALLPITLVVTAAGEMDVASAVVHMEEIIADSLGH
jgi:hypothetical protein